MARPSSTRSRCQTSLPRARSACSITAGSTRTASTPARRRSCSSATSTSRSCEENETTPGVGLARIAKPTPGVLIPQGKRDQDVAADNRDELFAVHLIRNRRRVDLHRPEGASPQQRAGSRVQRLEKALAAASEQKIRRSRQNAGV